MAEKRHNIVYKTTNTLNGKIYIGIHSTDNLNDGYLGSGRIFLKALKKYDKENFIREILFDFEKLIDALNKEEELVDEIFVCNNNNYNYAIGGKSGGGKSNIGRKHSKETLLKRKFNRPPMKESTKKKIGESNKGKKRTIETIEENRRLRIEFHKTHIHPNKGKSIHSDELKEKLRLMHTGKIHSEETKRKIRDGNLGKEKNGRSVINISTGVIYKSVTEASLKEGIYDRTLWRWLKNDNKHIKYC